MHHAVVMVHHVVVVMHHVVVMVHHMMMVMHHVVVVVVVHGHVRGGRRDRRGGDAQDEHGGGDKLLDHF